MKLAIASLVALAMAAPGIAQESGFYGTAGYSQISTDDVDLGAITLRGGWNFNQYFGAEAEGSFGVVSDDFTVADTQVDIDLNHAIGAFATAGVPLAERGRVFARVGYANVDIEGSSGGVSVSEDDSDIAYGIGGEYLFDDFNGVRVGYTAYDFDETLDVFEISYLRRF
jgi:outer membrane immunogenic protein